MSIIINSINNPGDDAITVTNKSKIIQNTIFDFREVPPKIQDEILSGVNGAQVELKNCILINGIKAILAGNGDYPISDYQRATWKLENCVFINCGRRCPEAQDGTRVYMKNCWIHNYGKSFDVRAFGSWAHRGGTIIAEDCLFTQKGGLFSIGLINTILDFFKHIGQHVNDSGLSKLLSFRTYLPGICRGLTADTGGLALATRCYKNHWWIKLENSDDSINREKARVIIEKLNQECPNIKEVLGLSLLELFDLEV